jgi:subtilase family serine protease
MPMYDALMQGGRTRVRPILMTAIATILALMPLGLGLSEGEIIASELATVVIGGLFTSTFLTLRTRRSGLIVINGGGRSSTRSSTATRRWAEETTLDVEWAHVFAPGAKILLVETPVSETEGVTGFPEIVKAENYVIDHNLADVISQSFGATEQTFPSKQSLLNLRGAFINAYFHNVTVLGASGDDGATDAQLNGSDLYTHRVNSWPSSDPLVTSIGGTQLTLDDAGNRLSPDMVWNDGYGAGGGGVSTVFSRPGFQDGVRRVVGSQRGTPDISLSAAVDGAVVLYYSFDPAHVGYHLVGGTSEATPEFAGIVAMADQAAHHRLGWLNGRLYDLHGAGSGVVDVTIGNNTYGPFTNSDNIDYTVTGYNAGPGYDLASGLGTLDAPRFVTALAGH